MKNSWLVSTCTAGMVAAALLGCGGNIEGGDGVTPVLEDELLSEPESEAQTITPVPSVRYARLTHEQWENSVRDLLALADTPGLSSTFPADARSAGFLFDNSAESLRVDQALWSAYGRAAATLAADAVADRARLSLLVPANPDDQSRARALVEGFGERAFRRPLSQAEVSRYLALFDLGDEMYEDTTGFEAGARLVIETMLQSPYFLYRLEDSTRVVDGVVPLSPWEIAQRLSFLITNSTPDAELLQAARENRLTTALDIRGQAARLLSSARAQSALGRYYHQLLALDSYLGITPSPSSFPEIGPGFGQSVQDSTAAYLVDVAFSAPGTFAELMTSSFAFVNRDLAPIYGVQGSFDERMVKVELPDERRGLLNQVGFLASNATSQLPDPIHRGVFISERILCREIAAPPDGVPPLPPVQGRTNRETVANHTESNAVCRACHATAINPLGFAFENFDAVGAYRTTDNGFEVDARVVVPLDGQQQEFNGSYEMVDAFALSEEAHGCFAKHLLEYALGRPATRADEPLVGELTRVSLDGASMLSLLVQLATSNAFIQRSAQELP